MPPTKFVRCFGFEFMIQFEKGQDYKPSLEVLPLGEVLVWCGPLHISLLRT